LTHVCDIYCLKENRKLVFTGLSHTLTLFGAESWFACHDYWAPSHKEADSINSGTALAHSEEGGGETETSHPRQLMQSRFSVFSLLLTVSLVL